MVEIGRVVLVRRGPETGKICAIVDVIDQNRVLVDGPSSGVKRQPLMFKDIRLTGFVIKIPHGCRTSFVKKVWDADDINTKFAATPKAKQLQAIEKRAALTDLERFRLYQLKQKVNRAVRSTLSKLKIEARKSKSKKAKAVKKPKTALNKKKKEKRLAKKAAAQKA